MADILEVVILSERRSDSRFVINISRHGQNNVVIYTLVQRRQARG